jgi:hypothetical protein
MSAEEWNFYYEKNEKRFTLDYFVNQVSLWGCIGLLWLSFLQIIGKSFPEFLEAEYFYYEFESFSQASLVSKMVGLDWLVIILFLIALWLPGSGLFSEKVQKYVRFCNLGAIVIPALYIWAKWEELISGAYYIALQYLNLFNKYMGTQITLPHRQDDLNIMLQSSISPELLNIRAGMPVAFTAIAMLLWLLVWGESRLTKRKVLLVFFPVFAVVAEFLVGHSPKGSAIMLVFVASWLLFVPEEATGLRRAAVLGIAVVGLVFSGSYFKEDIDKLSHDKTVIDQWIAHIEKPDWNWGLRAVLWSMTKWKHLYLTFMRLEMRCRSKIL